MLPFFLRITTESCTLHFVYDFFVFLMIRRPPRSTLDRSSAASDVYKRQVNNISGARKLEHAGVHVVYGIVGLKTHAKLCLVVRQEAEGLVRYCHIGTGNYNPKTARLYEDLGVLTCDPQVGEDLSRLFNQLSGIAPRSRFRRLLAVSYTHLTLPTSDLG